MMQSPVADNYYCPSCKQIMVVLHVAGIFDEYHKPMKITNCFLHQQQCPINNCTMAEDEATTTQGDTSMNALKSDQWSLFSEGMGYEETGTDQNGDSYNSLDDDQQQATIFSEGIGYKKTGTDHNGDSYNSLDDDQHQTTTCTQCCTLGSDEMVVPKLKWTLSTDTEHNMSCRYYREKVKDCYYDHYLVRCMEHKQENQEHSYHEYKDCYQQAAGQFINCDFAVNCIPVEETIVRSYF